MIDEQTDRIAEASRILRESAEARHAKLQDAFAAFMQEHNAEINVQVTLRSDGAPVFGITIREKPQG